MTHSNPTDPLKPIRDKLEAALGCFDAANAEGLEKKLREADIHDTGSLADLVFRRLLHATVHIDEALAAIAAMEAEQMGVDDQLLEITIANAMCSPPKAETAEESARRIITAIRPYLRPAPENEEGYDQTIRFPRGKRFPLNSLKTPTLKAVHTIRFRDAKIQSVEQETPPEQPSGGEAS